MKAGNASTTAAMVAALRARASTGEAPLLDDPWADGFAGPEGHRAAEVATAANRNLELWVALRTRFIDRIVADWRHDVVLLGAGFDARAARLAKPGRRFFEVDHPATQAAKQTVIAGHSGYPENAATLVPCDFETTDFAQALRGAGFDAGRPALFIWEGVSMYLTEEAVAATLSLLAGLHPESVVVFDHVSRNMAEGRNLNKTETKTRDFVEELGEPVTFGTNHILPLMANTGFRYVRTVAFDELSLADTGDYLGQWTFRFQWMVVASPTRPIELAVPGPTSEHP